jgi:hypothetical protein
LCLIVPYPNIISLYRAEMAKAAAEMLKNMPSDQLASMAQQTGMPAGMQVKQNTTDELRSFSMLVKWDK